MEIYRYLLTGVVTVTISLGGWLIVDLSARQLRLEEITLQRSERLSALEAELPNQKDQLRRIEQKLDFIILELNGLHRPANRP